MGLDGWSRPSFRVERSGKQRTIYSVLGLNDRLVLIAGVKITSSKDGKKRSGIGSLLSIEAMLWK
jgi:hypothetical protein